MIAFTWVFRTVATLTISI